MAFTVHPSLMHRLVSRSTFLSDAAANGKHYDKLVTGIAIAHPLVSVSCDPLRRILIVQRAAHEEFLPGVYELPGGHVEESDDTIMDAAARELYEETGLTVREFLAETPAFEYTVEKLLSTPDSESPTRVYKTTIQLNFVVKVVGDSSQVPSVKLDPQEHQNYAWVSKEEIAKYDMTDKMRVVVTDALAWLDSSES